ncbi:hypothetical protein FS837_005145 [Tulasnella sp. UAMH 9824]|nr:hypothetical protein FS837_005145 [Tulasnella sp. UAMH 9824]
MATASINDLPYDILYIIFTLCWNKIYSRKQGSFPTIASHVCRRWREYALDTPAFWARLDFRNYSLHLEKYQIWLERSKGHPLDILLGGFLFYQRGIKTIKEIMRLIVPYTNRWRTLRMFLLPDKIARIIFDRLLKIAMPMLIKLEVVHNPSPTPTKWRFRPFLFGGAPRLQYMTLERLSCDYIDARFASLRVLDIFDVETGTERASVIALKVRRILSRLPHLQSLRIRAPGSYPRLMDHNDTQSLNSDIIQPLSHGSLIELSLAAYSRARNAIITSLALPKVRYFLDRTRSNSDEWEIGLGICCLPVMETTWPFPNLISLRLAGNSTRSSNPTDPRNSSNLRHFPGALEGLKMLRSLTLDRVDLENEGRLNCLSKACPKLESLSLVCCTEFTLAELRSIVERRKTLGGADSLQRLAVYGMFDNGIAASESAATLWLEGEWSGHFVFRANSGREDTEAPSMGQKDELS